MSTGTGDPFDLGRFVTAQDAAGTYDRAVAEMRAGRKDSHWMWFVFPQLAGLGRSAVSTQFSISSLAEARAYLRHPVLGPRLAQCARILTDAPGNAARGPAAPGRLEPGRRSAEQIFGPLDAQKLRSSMTLFLRAAPAGETLFADVLGQYFGGQPDPATDALL